MGFFKQLLKNLVSVTPSEIEFTVAGVEYDTNKRSRQEILRTAVAHHAKLEEIKPYNGLSDDEINEADTVYEYENMRTTHIKLERDPENEYDPNAIKVMTLNTRGGYTTVGYVPRTDNLKVGQMLDNINSLEGFFTGGKFKTKKNGTVKEGSETRGLRIKLSS